MRYLTQQELEAGLAKWMQILHLQDWEITCELVAQKVFESRSQSACAAIPTNYNRSHIRVASFDTLDLQSHPEDHDMERTLVHELVHIVFRPADMFNDEQPNAATMRLYERAVENTARILVELDRRATINYGAPQS